MIDSVGPEQSIRRKCKVLQVRRQTYYRRKQGHRPEQEDARIASILRKTVAVFVAWGFWMVFHYLRKNGHGWNHKRVYRVWKEQGLALRKIPKRKKIKRKYIDLLAPKRANEGWAMDFVSDWVAGPEKQPVRLINVIDECTRKALWTEAHESISASKLIRVLDNIVEWRGKPAYIRCDNGPEFIAKNLQDWAEDNEIELRYIQPGKPSQNGLIERLNGTLRKECLNLEWFDSMEELNEKLQKWSHVYNFIRPHSSLGYKTPDEKELELGENLYFRAVAA